MLQTLSGARMHASLALSLGHDIMFALIAVNIVCFLRAMGVGRAALAALVFAATVMVGPVTLLRDGVYKLDSGFAILNYLTMSFRPHVALAYLLELGFLEVILEAVVLAEAASPPRWRVGYLAILAAALALTDESSLGMLGLGLGTLWLAHPAVLATTRRRGLLALAGLAAAIVMALVLFGGSIGPSAPHYQLRLVAPRAPGYASSPLPIATLQGCIVIAHLLPVLAR